MLRMQQQQIQGGARLAVSLDLLVCISTLTCFPISCKSYHHVWAAMHRCRLPVPLVKEGKCMR